MKQSYLWLTSLILNLSAFYNNFLQESVEITIEPANDCETDPGSLIAEGAHHRPDAVKKVSRKCSFLFGGQNKLLRFIMDSPSILSPTSSQPKQYHRLDDATYNVVRFQDPVRMKLALQVRQLVYSFLNSE